MYGSGIKDEVTLAEIPSSEDGGTKPQGALSLITIPCTTTNNDYCVTERQTVILHRNENDIRHLHNMPAVNKVTTVTSVTTVTTVTDVAIQTRTLAQPRLSVASFDVRSFCFPLATHFVALPSVLQR